MDQGQVRGFLSVWDKFRAVILDPLLRALANLRDGGNWLNSKPMRGFNHVMTKFLGLFKIHVTPRLKEDFRDQLRYTIRCFLLHNDSQGNYRQDKLRDLIIALFSGSAHFLQMNHEVEREEAKETGLDLSEELKLYQRQRWEIQTLYMQQEKTLSRCIASVKKRMQITQALVNRKQQRQPQDDEKIA